MVNKMKPIPEVGKFYHFFDDGKTGPSRHYICKVEELLTVEQAKEFAVNRHDTVMPLYDAWMEEVKECDFLYAKETDYFVRISCPTYDDNDLWAVRTLDGGWFTIDIQSWWQGGRIDITGDIYKGAVENFIAMRDDASVYEKVTYEKR